MNSCPHTDAGACAFCYAALLAEVKNLRTILDAAQTPRHDYCGCEDWFINLDKAVYEATADFGERYRDKYADSGKQT